MANASLYSNILESNFHTHLVIPELAEELGLDESIVLQQIHYWITKSGKLINDEFWIYNTFEDWKKQFKYWSISKIKRVFYSLEEKGYIHSKKMNVKKSNHTKWYTVDYNKLVSLISKYISEKKFVQTKNELSLYQSDTIINSKPYINSTNINNLSTAENHPIKTKGEESKQKKTKTEISQIEMEICEEMLKVWHDVFIYQKDRYSITKNRASKLLNLWDKHFHKDIEKWKSYCVSINSSKFLMGEKKTDFKARFDWLISEEVANRVISKEFDIGDRVPDVEAQMLKVRTEEQRKIRERQREQLEAQKALEEEKRKASILAEKLAYQELQKLEAAWSEEEKGEVQKTFENYMEQEVIEDEFLASFKSSFSRDKWASHLIGYVFEQFKIKFCLKKKIDDYLHEAQVQLGLYHKYKYKEEGAI